MKVVSLFSGCGGLDLGLFNSGHKIVYASDIDKDCCNTYELNFKQFQTFLKEIYDEAFPKS